MNMVRIPKFPKKMEELLGNDGKNEFIDFLNDSFHHQEDNVLHVVSDRFDRRVTEETGKVNHSVTLFDKRVTEEIAKVNQSVSLLDKRVTEEISGVKLELAGLRSDMYEMKSELKSEITMQTKWIVTILLAGSVIYPVVNKLLENFL